MGRSTLAAGLRHLRDKLAPQGRHEESDEQLLYDFTSRCDDSAFAALVHRHGSMVLNVCRRVLGHRQDAEDAFQATFLVLARNAARLRNKTTLTSFLHGTAFRTAMKAKQTAARRRKHEGQASSRPQADPSDELSWREVRTLLDEEIARLPEIYRSVFVLCCLENVSREETARRLDLKEGTISSRLAEARRRLAQRLARRGVELTGVLAATALLSQSASVLTAGLLAATTNAAAAMAAGEGLTSVASSSVADLVESATKSMMANKGKIASLILLVVTLLGGAGAWAYRDLAANTRIPTEQSAELHAAKEDNKPKIAPTRPDAARTVEIQGRVLAPDGKPRAGAKLALFCRDGVRQVGVTAADGRFAVAVPKQMKGEWPPALLAHNGDAGLDFISLAGIDAAKPIELRLVKDQAIRGRVVNTEGKPIAGVRVSVSSIEVFPNNSLESLLVHSQDSPADFVLPPGDKTLLLHTASLLDAVTDAQGRFVISGVGADRVAELYLREGGIAKTRLRIVNHEGFDPKPPNPSPFRTYGSPPGMANSPSVRKVLQSPNVSVVAEPEKPIRGVVKYADSGKGVPDVVVRLEQRESAGQPFVRTKTDAQGRYEFRGARKAKTYSLYVDSDSSTGYLPTWVYAADTVGYSPVNVDVRIKKGVIVTGKIIDRATGKAVPGFAQFTVLFNNPFAKDYAGVTSQREVTAEDGTFRVVVIPGPVLLMGGYYPPSTPSDHGPIVLLDGHYPPSSANFDYIEASKYRPPVADPEHPEYFAMIPSSRSGAVGYLSSGGGRSLIQGNYCKVLDIKPGTATVHQDILLERASVLEVKIQDPNGRPVEGVWATDFATMRIVLPVWIDRSSCPVYSREQRKSRLLTFYEPRERIVGSRRLEGDEKGPVVVKLGPTGAIKGRLLDTDDKPMAGALVGVMYREMSAGQIHQHIHRTKQVVTDSTGSFIVDELIPELIFELSVYRGKRHFERAAKTSESAIQVKPGECRDLGSIKLK
jgi:RNA polymerase sigma factor (sigma-70 family)